MEIYLAIDAFLLLSVLLPIAVLPLMHQDSEQKEMPMSRGLALLSPEKRREIATKGGIAVQAKGTGHQWTQKEASLASLKGWQKKVSKSQEELILKEINFN